MHASEDFNESFNVWRPRFVYQRITANGFYQKSGYLVEMKPYETLLNMEYSSYQLFHRVPFFKTMA